MTYQQNYQPHGSGETTGDSGRKKRSRSRDRDRERDRSRSHSRDRKYGRDRHHDNHYQKEGRGNLSEFVVIKVF